MASNNGSIGLNGSICVSDIPKEVYVTSKNGKKYLNFAMFIGGDADNYGNHGSITLPQSQEEREAKAKKTYIGNVKGFWSNGNAVEFEKVDALTEKKAVAVEVEDDLPF